MPRFYCPTPLTAGDLLELPAGAARHVQVLRLQPGDGVTLFNGGPGGEESTGHRQPGGEFQATITEMARSSVQVRVDSHHAVEREAARQIHLALGMPANERMDWLVEKATELGVASIQPLMTERSVLRLAGERAQKKQAHWQSVAIAASEQCGGNRVPELHPVLNFPIWLRTASGHEDGPAQAPGAAGLKLVLSLRPGTRALQAVVSAAESASGAPVKLITLLSGPEGGLSAAEEDAAVASGFSPVSLGPRVLRAETAALAALAVLAL